MKNIILTCILLPTLLFSQIRIIDTAFVRVLREYYPQCISINGYLDTTCALNSPNDYLYISGKNISDVSGINWFQCIKRLEIYNTSIQILPLLPKQLNSLSCLRNNVDSIVFPMPNGVRFIDLAANKIKAIKMLFPDSLTFLEMSENPLKNISGEYPKCLNRLVLNNMNLNNIDLKLPKSINGLSLNNCNLKQLPILPDSLKLLEASNNQLTHIDKLPLNLKALIVQDNNIESLPPVLPPNLITLMIRTNRLKTFPKFNRKTINLIEAGGNCFAKPLSNEKTDKYSLEFGPNGSDCK